MRPRLTNITLRGFKTIRELRSFDFGNLTVLIGPNGAGKTNFISFFRMLSWALVPPGQLQIYVAEQGGASALLHKGPGVTREIEAKLELATEAGKNEYGFRLFHAAGDTLVFADELFHFRRAGDQRPPLSLGAGHREPHLFAKADQGNKTAAAILGMLRRIIVYQFHNTSQTARIRSKWDVSDNRWLKEDAANLAPFLLRLQNESPIHYANIVATIRLVLPFFATFDLYSDSGRVLLQWREIGTDHVFNVSQASDGMLRTLALIALLLQPERGLPDVLILDEPELGLHPYAIEVIASLIHRAAEHVQIVVATQSVSLLDRFEPDSVVVADRRDHETSFRRLRTSDLTDWLENYTLSELWEKNVFGGGPSH